MGGNSSSRHVSLDEADEVTFVKGIRLSERVINRMKESPPVVRPQAPTRSSSTPPVESSVPDEHHVPIMPHSPSYASALVPPPLSEPPVTEETSTPPSSVQGLPIPPPTEESTVLPSGSAASDVVLLSKTPSPEKPPVVPSLIDQVEVFPHQTHVVNEEKLRKEIREGLQKLLNEEMKMAERNMRQRLEVEKAEAKAQAQAAARLQIQDEVQKVLDQEKPSYQQTLADAIRSEQLNAQEDRLITQYYWMERKAQKLEEKQKDLENQESLFQKQIAKMQEKAAQFTKITAEHHRKGLEDANSRFRRYQIKPVCLDLQSQIMKCYSENKGQTMSCSNIASLYIQCVDRAKQDKKLSTGG